MNILYISLPEYGHTNSSIGLIKKLQRFEHNFTYLTNSKLEKHISKYNIKCITCDSISKYDLSLEDISKKDLFTVNDYEKEYYYSNLGLQKIKNFTKNDNEILKIIKQISPDLIMLDLVDTYPFIIKSNIPYIVVWSSNLAKMMDSKFDESIKKMRMKFTYSFMNFLNAETKKQFKESDIYECTFTIPSPFLNVIIFPFAYESLNLPNYIRINNCVRPVLQKEKLKFEKDRKIIFITLGSNFENLNKIHSIIIDCLQDSNFNIVIAYENVENIMNMIKNENKNKFIIKKSLDNLAIIDQVDLVISHAGTNTIIECLKFNKLMLLIPMIFDQPITAEKLYRENISYFIELKNLNKSNLKEYIGKTLNNEMFKHNILKISKEMEDENCFEILNSEILKLKY